MAWIKTIPFAEADGPLRAAIEAVDALYPPEYTSPAADGPADAPGIVATHTLIPEALRHAFSTFGVLMAPDLPLARGQHEMIAAVVSRTNRCRH